EQVPTLQHLLEQEAYDHHREVQMATTGITYVELSEEAAVDVDLYLNAKRKKRDHDSKARNLDKTVKDALARVEEALDGHRLGLLPDGRQVMLEIGEEQHRKANAYSFTPRSLSIIDA